jgi:hypothetical protein
MALKLAVIVGVALQASYRSAAFLAISADLGGPRRVNQ